VGEVEGTPGNLQRLVPAVGQEVRLSEVGQEQRMVGDAHRCRVSERLLQEGHALGEAARGRVRVAEVRA
jgi:hypothetical protein